MLINLGEVHAKVVRKARTWMKHDQCKMEQSHTWREDEEVKTSPKSKMYVKVFVFAGRDAMECVVRYSGLGYIVILLRGEL